jgi:hypothetical protein
VIEVVTVSHNVYIITIACHFLKRLLAILFLLLLLFNTVGYRLYFYYAQQMADKALMASLDEGAYDHKDLMVIKVPLTLPYQTDWKDFERVDGEIDINGETYKYVKRKVVSGELVLLCLPDHHKTKLENAKDEFFKLVNNMQSQAPAKNTTPVGKVNFSNILSDFDRQQADLLFYSCKITEKVFVPFVSANHIAPVILMPTRPPEMLDDRC